MSRHNKYHKKARKEIEGNKLRKAKEDKGKRDDLITSKQTVQCIATRQTINLHHDMTLTKIKVSLTNTEKKEEKLSEDVAQVIQLAFTISDITFSNSRIFSITDILSC